MKLFYPQRVYYFISVQTNWFYIELGPAEQKQFKQAVVVPAWILLPMPPPQLYPFSQGPAPEEGTPRVSGEFRGARATRTHREKGADSDPPREEHAPDEPDEFRLPVP